MFRKKSFAEVGMLLNPHSNLWNKSSSQIMMLRIAFCWFLSHRSLNFVLIPAFNPITVFFINNRMFKSMEGLTDWNKKSRNTLVWQTVFYIRCKKMEEGGRCSALFRFSRKLSLNMFSGRLSLNHLKNMRICFRCLGKWKHLCELWNFMVLVRLSVFPLGLL